MQKMNKTAAISRHNLIMRRTSILWRTSYVWLIAAFASSFPLAFAQPTVLQSTPAKPAVLQLLPEPHLQEISPEVILNPSPTTSETNATKIRAATSKTLEFGYVPERSTFPTSDGRFRVKPMRRKTMALALGGGGMRGAAHAGVLKVLQSEGIPIDYIVGNSMGAIVGGLYAAGVPVEKLCDEQGIRAFRNSYVPTLGAKMVKLPLSLVLPFRTGPVGIMSGKKYQKFLQKQIPAGKENIEALNIPFSAVATNLLDGQAYRLSQGDLSLAMRASSALAPIIRPVKVGDKLCVDGGVRANLPASAARDTGADVVIAVVVDDKLKEVPEKGMWHYRQLAERMANIMLAVTDEQQMQFADIVIAPEVNNISILSKNKDDIIRAMNAGEIAARKALPLIREKLHLQPFSQLTESVQ